jgi:hypothetical protein
MFDDVGYLTDSILLYNALQTRGPLGFLAETTTPARLHPPMMKIVPIPVFLILGPGYKQALYAYLFLIPVFCLYLFLLVRAVFRSESLALTAVVITCTFPLTYGMWRNVMTEFGTATTVVAALYYLVRSDGLRVRRYGVLFGVLLGVALLWKISAPVFLIGPFAFVLVRRLGVQNLRLWSSGWYALRPLIPDLAVAGAVALMVAGPFYARSGITVLKFGIYSVLPGSNQMWSLGPVFSPLTVLKYWLNIVNWGISPYFFFWGIVLCVVLALQRRPRRVSATQWWFLLAWLIPPLLFFSFQVLKEIRHMLPSYPVFGILLALGLQRVLQGLSGSAQIAVVGSLCVYPAYQFAQMSFDSPWFPRRDFAIGRLVFSVRDLELASLQFIPTYTYPANPVSWPVDPILALITAESHDRTRSPRVRFVGDNPYLNGLVLQYESLRMGQPVISHGPFPHDDVSTYDFVVRLCGPEGRYGPVDTRDQKLEMQLDRGVLAFTRIGHIQIPAGCDVQVYSRR